MSVKERLTKYIKYKGITKSAFCNAVGVSNAFVSSMRKSMQPDKIQSIALKFPDLNTGWLMTGEGEMLNKNSTSGEKNAGSMVEPSTLSGSKGDQYVTIPREVFEIMNSQVETIKSQQRTIEDLVKKSKHYTAPREDNAGFADAG